jgi:hypothetical protein
VSIFQILAEAPPNNFGEKISTKFPDNAYEVSNGANGTWFVYAPGKTSKDVLEELEASKGAAGKIIITSINSFFGWHNRDLWEWLAARNAR